MTIHVSERPLNGIGYEPGEREHAERPGTQAPTRAASSWYGPQHKVLYLGEIAFDSKARLRPVRAASLRRRQLAGQACRSTVSFITFE